MKKFKLERGNAPLEGNGGQVLCGRLLKAFGLVKAVDKVSKPTAKQKFSDGEISGAMVSLFCEGRTDFCNIELFRDRELLEEAYGFKFPSEETLRQRLDAMAADERVHDAVQGVIEKSLEGANLGTVMFASSRFVLIDGDLTPADNSKTKKEGIGFTYKKFDGYGINPVYIGNAGHILNIRLQPGNDHCQNGYEELLTQSIERAKRVSPGSKFLVRLDSGNDAVANRKIMRALGVSYIVKLNLRDRRYDTRYIELARMGEVECLAPGVFRWRRRETVETDAGSETHIIEVIERDADKKGNPLFDFERYEISVFATNEKKATPDETIERYHQHGTCEQFHSEIKSDLDFERLPSGKFATNRLLTLLCAVAYNLLRKIGCDMVAAKKLMPVPTESGRLRLKTVIANLIRIPCRMGHGGNYTKLFFGCNCLWMNLLSKLYDDYTRKAA